MEEADESVIIRNSPFFYSAGNSKIRQLLKDAMAEYEKHTCIKFVERENQVDYVEFYYGEG